MDFFVKILEDPILENTYILISHPKTLVPMLVLSVYEWEQINNIIKTDLKRITEQNG